MEIQIILSAFVSTFSLGLLLITLKSYRNSKNKKLLILSIAFFIFLIKGILLSLSLFNYIPVLSDSSTMFGLFDVIILTILFVSTLKR